MPKLNNPNIVVIGGGTGSFTLLGSLKQLTPNITALVNMADDGGSTGVLRDELGVLPPGDVRQCLVALSDASSTLRELFNYRFPADTSFAGHSFGNLFLSAFEHMGNNFGEAVELASKVLNITGRVVPITLDNCNLMLEIDDSVVKGEYQIAHTDFKGHAPTLWLEPAATANPVAVEAIMQADLIVIAPGNLYGSLAPALLVQGIAEALQATKSKVSYICNLVNKPVQTRDFFVQDYVQELEKFTGREVIDYVLYNIDQPSEAVMGAYALDGEYPVELDRSRSLEKNYQTIGGHFLGKVAQQRNANDTLILRSLIRHDAEAICTALARLI